MCRSVRSLLQFREQVLGPSRSPCCATRSLYLSRSRIHLSRSRSLTLSSPSPPSFSPPLPPSLPPLPPPTGPPHPLTHTSTSQAKKAQEEALSIEKVLLQVLSSPPHPRTLTPARARTSARRARASADTLYGSVRKCVKE